MEPSLTLFEMYASVKFAVCAGLALLLALSTSACTSNFGAVGGAEIQRLYNERVAIKTAQEAKREGVRWSK